MLYLPSSLLDRFPPSSTRLFDHARGTVDDSMLWDIARADYGNGADEAFAALQSILDEGIIPVPMSGLLLEVLRLTQWCDPEHPNPPPFDPGPTGVRGHYIRLLACAILFRADAEPGCLSGTYVDDSTLAQCLASAGVLGDEFNQGLGCLLTWQFHSSDYPVLTALALLAVAIRFRTKPLLEEQLNHLAELVLSQDLLKDDLHAPVAFSIQQGLWRGVIDELDAKAATMSAVQSRENLQLCALLVQQE